MLCPARLAWQLYLTQPMSTRRQSACHHAMYPGQRVPPNAPSLHEQRSCTGTSWLMLTIQHVVIPSQMQGHAVVVAVTVVVAVAVAGAVGVAVAVVVAMMQQAVPSPLAVPMWRQPLLLHQLRKNFAGVRPSQCATRVLPPPAIDVDAESSSAPVPHLLSEGDFFPTDTEAALKQEGKEQR